jgi:hypothetical protein
MTNTLKYILFLTINIFPWIFSIAFIIITRSSKSGGADSVMMLFLINFILFCLIIFSNIFLFKLYYISRIKLNSFIMILLNIPFISFISIGIVLAYVSSSFIIKILSFIIIFIVISLLFYYFLKFIINKINIQRNIAGN